MTQVDIVRKGIPTRAALYSRFTPETYPAWDGGLMCSKVTMEMGLGLSESHPHVVKTPAPRSTNLPRP